MALIKCEDCGCDVSDIAPSCPKCGRPTKATTIEQTNKKWKSWKLLFVGLILLSWMIASAYPAVATTVGLCSIAGLIVVSVMSWWHHG